jgi:putative salt-induced outer membrane protein YdiY
MRASWLTVSALAIAIASGGAMAQEETEARSWTNKTELGFVSTSGNTETTNLTFANKYTHTWTKAEFVFDVFALRAENTERFLSNPDGSVDVTDETKLTAEQYFVAGKYTRQIHEKLGWYGLARWSRNQFAGIQNRMIGGAGLSYTFFSTDVQKLVAEAGIDYTDEEGLSGDSRSFAGMRLFGGYLRKFGKNAEFTSDLEYLMNLDDTADWRVNWVNSVTATLTERIALKFSYAMLYDDQPVVVLVPPDADAPIGTPDAPFMFDELDTILTASVVINF